VVGEHVSGEADTEAAQASGDRTGVQTENGHEHRHGIRRAPRQQRQHGALQQQTDDQQESGAEPG
jgi:hypothetical protein